MISHRARKTGLRLLLCGPSPAARAGLELEANAVVCEGVGGRGCGPHWFSREPRITRKPNLTGIDFRAALVRTLKDRLDSSYYVYICTVAVVNFPERYALR